MKFSQEDEQKIAMVFLEAVKLYFEDEEHRNEYENKARSIDKEPLLHKPS